MMNWLGYSSESYLGCSVNVTWPMGHNGLMRLRDFDIQHVIDVVHGYD